MSKRGFTAFFAVLVASLALAVGLAIYDLLSRELALSQVATQSQYAIFAADTGAECALYWDNKYTGATAPSAFATSSTFAAPSSGLMCNGTDIAGVWSVASSPTAATTTFQITTGSPACALVTVAKSGNPSQTTVVAHGYNTCATTGVVRIERALQVTY